MTSGSPDATVLIVPGLRDHVEEHWQTHLAKAIPGSVTVPPIGRNDLDCNRRIDALERAAASIPGPVVIVAHSGGVITVVHWADRTRRVVQGALLAAPADLETPMPPSYPSLDEMRTGGWLPIPRNLLPFPSVVAASRNDPLASFDRAAGFAQSWGAEFCDIGYVGHLNPASGFGPWPRAVEFAQRFDAMVRA